MSAILFNFCTKSRYDCFRRLLAFESSIGSGADLGGCGRLVLEEAGEKRVEERLEDNLSAIGDRESHPQDQDELEDVVES